MMPAMIPSSAMPAQISTSVPKLVVLAELVPSAKQPMNEKKLRFLMFVSLLVFSTRMFNFIHRLRAAINGFSFAESRTRA